VIEIAEKPYFLSVPVVTGIICCQLSINVLPSVDKMIIITKATVHPLDSFCNFTQRVKIVLHKYFNSYFFYKNFIFPLRTILPLQPTANLIFFFKFHNLYTGTGTDADPQLIRLGFADPHPLSLKKATLSLNGKKNRLGYSKATANHILFFLLRNLYNGDVTDTNLQLIQSGFADSHPFALKKVTLSLNGKKKAMFCGSVSYCF